MRRLRGCIGFSYDVSNSYRRTLSLQVEDLLARTTIGKPYALPKKAHVGLKLITVGQSPLASEGILFTTV
jgi:hypothetical protein